LGLANIRGFKNPEKTKLDLYRRIARVAIESVDNELIEGLTRDQLLSRVKLLEPEADLQNLQKALIRIDRLQTDRKILPLILSYSDGSNKRLALVDREFLFYRRYKTAHWPWVDDPLYDIGDDDDAGLGSD
jgi:hypothetical protein